MAKQDDLLPVEEAQRRILERFKILEAEEVDLDHALGRVLAAEVTASLPLPPFANSSMDGFAVVAADTASASRDNPVSLRVTHRILAGSAPGEPIGPSESARIMTGAQVPPGADSVVPFEHVEDHGDLITVHRPVEPGACIRLAGQDIRDREAALGPGELLGPPQIALLAALGRPAVPVVRRPDVAILATGDELVPPGTPLRPGQIYNSNLAMLEAAVAEAGGIGRPIETARDAPQDVARGLDAARGADLLITSGGASVGDLDFVKAAVADAGELSFWRVRVRPGKPLLFGAVGRTPVIGLPGNPTSAFATFELFARPAIRTMLGLPPFRPQIEVVVDETVDNRGGRRTYARVRFSYDNGSFHAKLAGPQDSAMLVPLARADGFLEVPEDRDELRAGDVARAHVWRLPA
ncbi:MAG TPA: gephyrin-like molybdotransferase Glp [Chloroflexota bacterium]|nr:gephyrin-like molybdotransferase Glp [Chloroflexota bacterium]